MVKVLSGGELISTDVLVVGGGYAGCMAAIKASEHGVRVTLAEKGNTKRSGAAGTGNDHFYFYHPEIHAKAGWTIQGMIKDQIRRGYKDQELEEIVAKESYARVLDLERFGVKFRYNKIYPWNYFVEPGEYEEGKFRIIPQFFSVPNTLNYDGRDLKRKLTAEALKRGVNILNRVMITKLLKSNGAVVGATGLNTRTGDFIILKAKATVLAAGRGETRLFRNPTGYLFNTMGPPNCTADGHVMALKAGAEITVIPPERTVGQVTLKNFPRTSFTATTCYPAGKHVNAKGEVLVEHPAAGLETHENALTVRRKKETSIREGLWPFYLDLTQATEEEIKYAEWSTSNESTCWALLEIMRDMGIDLRKDKLELDFPKPGFGLSGRGFGVWIDTECATSLKGLYAAGDLLVQVGGAAPPAVVLGWRAGDRASKHALEAPEPLVDEKQIEEERRRIFAPMERKDGLTWQELNIDLNNIMTDFVEASYVGGMTEVRSDYALRYGLERLNTLRGEPLKASNPHELMRCLEVLNLIDVGELLIKAFLDHRLYEADKWFTAKLVDEELTFSQKPIVYK